MEKYQNARVYPFANPIKRKEDLEVRITGRDISKELPAKDVASADAYFEEVFRKKSPNAYSKPTIPNLSSFERLGRRLIETDDLASYALYLAKNNDDFKQYAEGLSEPASIKIRPRGTTSVTITSDGKTVFKVRGTDLFAGGELAVSPEIFYHVDMPNPFERTLRGLEAETGLTDSSVMAMEIIGIGEELKPANVVDNVFLIYLNASQAQLERSVAQLDGQGKLQNIRFKDTSYEAWSDYLENDRHPGSCNIAVLSFVRFYHGAEQFEKLVSKLGIEYLVSDTLEEFCEPMGVTVKGPAL